jgi:hypothetical protein
VNRTPRVEPTDCADVTEARVRGVAPSEEALRHAARCPLCAAAASGPVLPAPPDALFAAVESEVAAEQGLAARLRSLPTARRLLLAVGWAALLVTAAALATPRAAYGPVPVTRVVLVVTVLATLLALAVRLGLRPVQAPPVRRGAVVGSFLAGLLSPLVFALLPRSGPVVEVGAGIGDATAMLVCFALGLAPGVLVVLALRWLDRLGHGSRSAALLAAAAGGLAGNAALELHCPVTAPVHLLLGHATVGFALAAGYALVHRRGRR